MDELLTFDEVSELIGVSVGTLRNWRNANVGIPSFKVGRRVVYRRSAIDQWLNEQEKATIRGSVA